MSKNNQIHNLRARNSHQQQSSQQVRKNIRAQNVAQTEPVTSAQKLMATVASACNWDDLQGIVATMGNGIVTYLHTLGEQSVRIAKAGVSDQLFLNIVKSATEDATNTSNELKAIKARHDGKTGRVSPDDMPLYYELGEAYTAAWEKFQTLSFQTGTEITNYTSGLLSKMDQNQNVEKVVDATLQQPEQKAE